MIVGSGFCDPRIDSFCWLKESIEDSDDLLGRRKEMLLSPNKFLIRLYRS